MLYGLVPSLTRNAVYPPENTALSKWLLDEAGGATLVDARGTQDGTYNGTPSYSLNPMAVGSTGKSVGLAASSGAYLQVPDNAAYHLAAGTLTFIFELAAVSAQQILVSKEGPNVVGSLTVDVSGGQLRAYIYSGTLPVDGFPFPTGAGTIAANTAYRLTITWGPRGAEMWLDATLIGSAPTVTTGLTLNTEPWFFFRYNNGQVPATGAIDDIELHTVQLTGVQIAALPAAQSITLPSPPVIATPIVPRMDTFLVNDDMPQYATAGSGRIFVSPTGNGSGADPNNPGSLSNALSGALGPVAGGTAIILRQGYYSAPNGLTVPNGTSAASPVTLVAYPGEWAVFCKTIDLTKIPGHPQAPGRTAQVAWTLWNAAYNIWRIPYVIQTTSFQGNAMGVFLEAGIAHKLLPYDNVSDMMQAQSGNLNGDLRDSVGAPQTRHMWWCAGVAQGDSNGGTAIAAGQTHWLYIRYDRPNWSDVGWVDPTVGAWPDDDRWHLGVEGQTTAPRWFSRSNPSDFRTGRPVLPNPKNLVPNSNGDFPGGNNVDRNPNDAKMFAASCTTVNLLSGGSFVRLGSGINSIGYRYIASGRSNYELHRGIHHTQAGIIQGNCANMTFHRCRMFLGSHRLIGSMAVQKYDEFANPPNQGWQNTNNGHSAAIIQGGTSSNLTFDNCLIEGYHEFLVSDTSNVGPINGLRLVNCCIMHIFDEFSQCKHAAINRWETGYCYFRGVSPNIGQNFQDVATQSPFGSQYFHHCIVDNRLPRASFDPPRLIAGSNVAVVRAAQLASSEKSYNNTLISGIDGIVERIGGWGSGSNSQIVLAANATTRLQYNEVFNNIIACHDNKRYYNNEGGVSRVQSDGVELGAVSGYSNHCGYRDYNCFSRHGTPPASGSSNYINGKWKNNRSDTAGSGNFPSFAYIHHVPAGESTFTGYNGRGSQFLLFKGSAEYNATTQPIPHPTGAKWEDNSTDENPQLPSCGQAPGTSFPANRMDYRPRNIAQVQAPATPPSGGAAFNADWWTSPILLTSYGATPVPINLTPSAFKGALDPSGSTCPVGVQNP